MVTGTVGETRKAELPFTVATVKTEDLPVPDPAPEPGNPLVSLPVTCWPSAAAILANSASET